MMPAAATAIDLTDIAKRALVRHTRLQAVRRGDYASEIRMLMGRPGHEAEIGMLLFEKRKVCGDWAAWLQRLRPSDPNPREWAAQMMALYEANREVHAGAVSEAEHSLWRRLMTIANTTPKTAQMELKRELAAELGISLSQVNKKLRRAMSAQGGGPKALARTRDRKAAKRRYQWIDGETGELLDCHDHELKRRCIEQFQLLLTKRDTKLRQDGGSRDVDFHVQWVRELIRNCQPPVGRTTIYRWHEEARNSGGVRLNRLTPKHRREHFLSQGPGYEPPYANHTWCCDGMRIDGFCFDPVTQRARRGMLFPFVDEFSRSVMGSAAGYSESRELFSSALFDAICQSSERPQCGIAEFAWMDNGKVELSNDVRAWMRRLGMEPVHCQPYSGWSKKIESWFNWVHKHVDAMMFSDLGAYCPYGRGLNDEFAKEKLGLNKLSNARRLPTIDEYHEFFRQQVAQVYHQTEHSSLKQTPDRAWRENVPEERLRIPEAGELYTALLPMVDRRGRRQVRKHRLTVQGLTYILDDTWAPIDDIIEIDGQRIPVDQFEGETLKVRYLPGDIRKVLCLADDDRGKVLGWAHLEHRAISADRMDWQSVAATKRRAREAAKAHTEAARELEGLTRPDADGQTPEVGGGKVTHLPMGRTEAWTEREGFVEQDDDDFAVAGVGL